MFNLGLNIEKSSDRHKKGFTRTGISHVLFTHFFHPLIPFVNILVCSWITCADEYRENKLTSVSSLGMILTELATSSSVTSTM